MTLKTSIFILTSPLSNTRSKKVLFWLSHWSHFAAFLLVATLRKFLIETTSRKLHALYNSRCHTSNFRNPLLRSDIIWSLLHFMIQFLSLESNSEGAKIILRAIFLSIIWSHFSHDVTSWNNPLQNDIISFLDKSKYPQN